MTWYWPCDPGCFEGHVLNRAQRASALPYAPLSGRKNGRHLGAHLCVFLGSATRARTWDLRINSLSNWGLPFCESASLLGWFSMRAGGCLHIGLFGLEPNHSADILSDVFKRARITCQRLTCKPRARRTKGSLCAVSVMPAYMAIGNVVEEKARDRK